MKDQYFVDLLWAASDFDNFEDAISWLLGFNVEEKHIGSLYGCTIINKTTGERLVRMQTFEY